METNTLDSGLIKDKLYSIDANIASAGKRFANMIIDIIAFYILSFLVGAIIGILGLYQSDAIWLTVLVYGIWFAYFIIMEATLGKTIGKMITKTKVVTEDGNKPDFKTAIIRTLCRIIPFEAFSFLGTPAVGWHDSLAKSRVVNDN